MFYHYLLAILPVQVHCGYAIWHPVTGTTLSELTVWRMLAEIVNIWERQRKWKQWKEHNRRSELFEQQIETRFSAIILKPILESYVSIASTSWFLLCVGFIQLHALTFVTTRKWSLNQTAVKFKFTICQSVRIWIQNCRRSRYI